jgi:DNA-binding NtrC family response regulator
MSTQSEILMFNSIPHDRGFVVSAKARGYGAAEYVSRPSNGDGDDFAARAGETSDSSRREESPQQPSSRDDYRVEQNPGGRPHIEIPPGTSLEDLERAAVEKALQVHRGNRTHAAKTLGISVRTLQRKLKAWRLPALTFERHSPRSDFSSPFAN